MEMPLRGPRSQELADRVDEARRWAEALRVAALDGQAYQLIDREIGGRHVGRTRVPVRARIDSWEQAWCLLSVHDEVERFGRLVALASDPAAREWALAHPLRAVGIDDDWPAVLAAAAWLRANRGQGRYLREVTAPGVDTKLIERRRTVIAALLDVPVGAKSFEAALGLAVRPATVRLRFAAHTLGMPRGVTEAVLRAEELDALATTVRSALIVENEVSYLSVPVPRDGVVLWGKGYDAERPASLSWLRGVPVTYWGDLDTHGFAILHRVRSLLPQTRSVLMGARTLIAHRDRWGTESTPTDIALPLLDHEEASVYEALVTDRYGKRVRLEQERIDWAWAIQRLEPG
ncbi:hypothetical protein GCM10025874_20610 [Arenivirga flava]|uniref:DUF3322 and DUF2220 domain-containing protein n=2 Tax=Arenivirga flava TaxID=1930060 RepID=A0AA37UHC0_9MICO|nr:hypothetical protein GCM10025874_20610 [Arenivirga flava]